MMESRIFLIFLLLTTCLFIPSNTQILSLQNDEAFTSIVISQQGLDFLKNLLITKAISSIIPLKLPKIEKTVKVPFLGHVNMELSNITIYEIQVLSSHVTPGDTGVAIIASGTTCNLSLDWFYEYSGGWLVPVEISDSGSASVQVEGMQVGLTVSLENLNGTLKLSPLQCGCYVEDISINLDGGASWLYQGMVNAFDDQIRSTVESSITKELGQAVLKLDSFLQSLPKEIPVDDNAALNVTFVNNPSLTSSSIGLDINGLFTARKKMLANRYNHIALQPSVECMNPSKMLGISLDEAVFASASALYYDAKFLQWIVDKDKVPQQSLLNTAEWRFIIPQLYKKYRNDDMNLNITLSSPPVIKITEHGVDAIVYADLIIDVLEADQVIPVACISLEIHGSGAVQISGNNLGGSIKVDDFTMSLKWSDIGTLRLYLVQPVMWTLMRTVFLPYVNARLGHGFPLPIIHGFTLEDAEIVYSSSNVAVCCNISYSESQVPNDSVFVL